MTLVKSHYQSTPMQIAKNPGSLTPFVAGICQETLTFARTASLLYYMDYYSSFRFDTRLHSKHGKTILSSFNT